MQIQWAAGMDVGKHQDHTSLALITWTEEYRDYLNRRKDYLPDGRRRGGPHPHRVPGEDELWREFEPQERYILKWLKNLQPGHSYTWQASAVVDDVLKSRRLPSPIGATTTLL